MSEPFAPRISNPHRDDYWTCPGCYEDLGDVGKGTHTCPSCNRTMECTIEYEPACYSTLSSHEEEEA